MAFIKEMKKGVESGDTGSIAVRGGDVYVRFTTCRLLMPAYITWQL